MVKAISHHRENKIYTTPRGIACCPWLNNPDTKFRPEGEYSVKLKIVFREAKDLIKLIDNAIKRSVIEAKKGIVRKIIMKKAPPPYTMELNENGDTTGFVMFRFKMMPRIGQHRQIEQKPKLFDSRCNETSANIGNSSIVRVAFEIIPFYVAFLGAGVTLRLCAVQVITLVQDCDGFWVEEGFI
jgi:hypothetical protein